MSAERLIRSSSVLDRANTIFDLVESQSEAGAFTGFLLDNLLCSPGQLARGHVAVRDVVAKARGKAYIRYEGAYLVTQDPDRCCGYIAAKVKSVHTELDRLLSCAISPFGDAVTQYAVSPTTGERSITCSRTPKTWSGWDIQYETSPSGRNLEEAGSWGARRRDRVLARLSRSSSAAPSDCGVRDRHHEVALSGLFSWLHSVPSPIRSPHPRAST